MTLNKLARESYDIAVDHGFYEDYKRVSALLTDPKDQKFLHQIWLSHRLMLIVSELAEGLEAVRNGNLQTEPKSGGLGEEIADTQIRLADLFRHIYGDNFVFDTVVKTKAEFNKNRPYKHGRSL